jgi:alkanesulfonate monooxygenase SsuD/methylene tetrahydromethanopterin reductase-like flavin-dependent oxidoreductase (luciferase family)
MWLPFYEALPGREREPVAARPLQQPHPPVWLPGVSSLETIEAAAKNRYTFMQVFSPRSALVRACRMYREAAERFGYRAQAQPTRGHDHDLRRGDRRAGPARGR